ncbi:hypothetical protein FQN54_006943 [Arachnomyces sp. PD_36]|nr:hypothetical protein FQN54_006943 [Arachnomyces sp. PD_36]
METVGKVYHAASHAVFGEEHNKSGEEPISGQTGRGTATDPYDAGNKEEQAQETPKESTQQTATEDTAGLTGKSSTLDTDPTDSKNTFDRSAQRAEPDAPSDATPTVAGGIVGDPSSGTNPTPKQQGADKPLDAPNAEQTSSIQDRKSKTEDTQNPAFGNQEFATGGGTASSHNRGQDTSSTTDTARKSEEQPTGEKYVKSSGFAAEGGDFDATKPGAGREADRLLGHHEGTHTGGGESHANHANGDAGGHNGQGKPKMMSKVKDKLHLGKHHDVKA